VTEPSISSAQPLWRLVKDGHLAEARVRLIEGVGVELRCEWNGDVRVSQVFKTWDELEAAATDKRSDLEARSWQSEADQGSSRRTGYSNPQESPTEANMKVSLCSVMLILVVVTTVGCQSRPDGLTPAQKQAVAASAKSVVDTVFQKVNQLDFAGALAVYSNDPDARYIENGVLVPSLDALKQEYA